MMAPTKGASTKGKTKHQEDRYTVPDNTPKHLRDTRERPKGKTFSHEQEQLGVTTSDGVRMTLKPIFKLKQSLLFKIRFMFTSEEGTDAFCPDDRNRVWKLWSRIIDGIQGQGGEEFQLLTSGMMTVFKSARHFVLPRKADSWSLEAFHD